jgi:hypothetical protein
MDFYLSKPVKIKDLQAFIDKTFIFWFNK